MMWQQPVIEFTFPPITTDPPNGRLLSKTPSFSFGETTEQKDWLITQGVDPTSFIPK